MDKKSIVRSSVAGLLACGMAATVCAQEVQSAEGGALVVTYPVHRMPSAEEQAASPIPLSVEIDRDLQSQKHMKYNERWNDGNGSSSRSESGR